MLYKKIRRITGEFFTFTRSERRGIIVLLGLIILVILARNLLPALTRPDATDLSQYVEEIARFEESIKQEQQRRADNPAYRNKRDQAFISHGGDESGIHERVTGGRTVTGSKTGTDSMSGTVFREKHYKPVLLNLNLSDSLELIKIDGVGPVLSRRIVKYRNLIGGFVCKEQLLEVYGINEDNYEKISRQVYIDTAGIRYIHLNTADISTLSRHPYLDDYQVRAIISFRKINGRFAYVGQLLEENLLPEETYNRIRNYLKAD